MFQVNANVTASISGLTITDGNATGSGGGLSNAGTTTLSDVTIAENTASTVGGGLYNKNGTATLSGVTVTGNTAATDGGGLYNTGGSTITLSNSYVTSNFVTGLAGGLFNGGQLDVANGGSLSVDRLTNAGTFTVGTGSTVTLGTFFVSGGSVSSAGSFAVTGTTYLDASTVLSGPTFSFGGPINDRNQPNDLTIDGNASFDGDIGDAGAGLFPLDSLNVSGTTAFGTGVSQVNTTNATNEQEYQGPVTVDSSITFNGYGIWFLSTLDGTTPGADRSRSSAPAAALSSTGTSEWASRSPRSMCPAMSPT